MTCSTSHSTRPDAESGNELLAAALDYATRGWAVFPLAERSKLPKISKADGGDGFYDATTDEAQIREWWGRWPNANVGIRTGPESGLVVLDIDPDHGGEKSLGWYEQEFGPLPDTATGRTGGDGTHLYYTHPSDGSVPGKNAFLPGLDIKSAGGYVVGPPSIHASGERYAWDPEHGEALAPAPEGLVDALRGGSKRRTSRRVTGDTEEDTFPEGDRNSALASLAGTMRWRGMSEAGILAALQAENEARCDPPLPDSEVEQIAASYGQYEPDPEADVGRSRGGEVSFTTGHMRTDTGNAERLVELYGHVLHYVPAKRQWLAWDGNRWRPDEHGAVTQLAKLTVRSINHEAGVAADKGEREELRRHAKSSEGVGRIRAMIDLARTDPGIPLSVEDLDTNKWLLGCPNGTVDLRTGELLRPDKANLITKTTGVNYDCDAKCPEWDRFIDWAMSNDAGMVTFLQRAIGYSLSGDVSERIMLVLHGEGANGKSTFLDATRRVFGDYADVADKTLILARREISGNNPELAKLPGIRLVTLSETERGQRFATAAVKGMSGGNEPVSATAKYEHPIKFYPQFTLWLATNDKPNVPEDDQAFWDRVKLVPFANRISEKDKDLHLPEKLAAEAEGILAWAVRGCVDYVKHGGLAVPEKVTAATSEYRAEMDSLLDFFEDRCVVARWVADRIGRPGILVTDTEPKAGARPLYVAYTQWAQGGGQRSVDERTFKRSMERHGFVRKRTEGTFKWYGIALNTHTSGEPGSLGEPFRQTSSREGFHKGKFDENTHLQSPTLTGDGPTVEDMLDASDKREETT